MNYSERNKMLGSMMQPSEFKPVLPTPIPATCCGDRIKPCTCGADVWKSCGDNDCGDWEEEIFECGHCGKRIYIELPD